MKISKDLPQFNNEKALLIVTGKQEAIFYKAFNGEIEKAREIEIPTPKYSDKEGFFKTRSGSGIIRSGAVLEPPKWKTINEFNKYFLEELKKMRREFESIYIFSPAYLLKMVKDEIPADLKENIKGTFKGDYCHQHPFEILKKIKKQKEAPLLILKKEAARIIEKSKIARRIIRGK